MNSFKLNFFLGFAAILFQLTRLPPIDISVFIITMIFRNSLLKKVQGIEKQPARTWIPWSVLRPAACRLRDPNRADGEDGMAADEFDPFAQVRAAQVRVAQVRVAQVRAAGSSRSGPSRGRFESLRFESRQVRAAQVRVAQVRAAQVRAAQVRVAQVRGRAGSSRAGTSRSGSSRLRSV